MSFITLVAVCWLIPAVFILVGLTPAVRETATLSLEAARAHLRKYYKNGWLVQTHLLLTLISTSIVQYLLPVPFRDSWFILISIAVSLGFLSWNWTPNTQGLFQFKVRYGLKQMLIASFFASAPLLNLCYDAGWIGLTDDASPRKALDWERSGQVLFPISYRDHTFLRLTGDFSETQYVQLTFKSNEYKAPDEKTYLYARVRVVPKQQLARPQLVQMICDEAKKTPWHRWESILPSDRRKLIGDAENLLRRRFMEISKLVTESKLKEKVDITGEDQHVLDHMTATLMVSGFLPRPLTISEFYEAQFLDILETTGEVDRGIWGMNTQLLCLR